MTDGVKTILYPVKDLAKGKAIFTALLGVEPSSDALYYVGYEAAGQQVGLVPNGSEQGMTGATPYWHVADIKGTLAALVAAGATIKQDANGVGGGRLVALAVDAEGNSIGLIQDAS